MHGAGGNESKGASHTLGCLRLRVAPHVSQLQAHPRPTLMRSCTQGFWKGVLPSIVMVSNPSVNYMLYEYLRARLEDWRRALTVGGGAVRQTTPTGAPCAMLAAGGAWRVRHPCHTCALQGLHCALRTGAAALDLNHGKLWQPRPTGASCCLQDTQHFIAQSCAFFPMSEVQHKWAVALHQ